MLAQINSDKLATFFGASASIAQLLGACDVISHNNSLLASGLFSIGWAWVTNKKIIPSILKIDKD